VRMYAWMSPEQMNVDLRLFLLVGDWKGAWGLVAQVEQMEAEMQVRWHGGGQCGQHNATASAACGVW
jgi:hypothetical protein